MLAFYHILWLLFFVYFLHLLFLCILHFIIVFFFFFFLFVLCFGSYFCFFLLYIHFSFSIFACFYHYSLIILYLFSISFSCSLFITQYYFIIHHSPNKLDWVFSYWFNLHKEICVEICLISSLFFFAYFLCASYFHLLLLQYPFWQ